LGNLLPFEVPFATILTMVEVDPGDPGFKNPTKFIGPVYTESEAQRLKADKGWAMKKRRRQVATCRGLTTTQANLRNSPH
jgi:carbamate kinase